MSSEAIELIVNKLRRLPDERIVDFLHYVEQVEAGALTEAKPGPLAKHFGVIDREAGEEMERIIEECFEQVNPDEWNRLP